MQPGLHCLHRLSLWQDLSAFSLTAHISLLKFVIFFLFVLFPFSVIHGQP